MHSKLAWDEPEEGDQHALETLVYDSPSMEAGATLAGHPVDPGHVLVLARGRRRALARVVQREVGGRCGGLALRLLDPRAFGPLDAAPTLLYLDELSVVYLRWPTAREVRCLLSGETAGLLDPAEPPAR